MTDRVARAHVQGHAAQGVHRCGAGVVGDAQVGYFEDRLGCLTPILCHGRQRRSCP